MGDDALDDAGALGSGTGLSGSGSGDFADGMENIGISSGEPDTMGTGGLDQNTGSGTGLSGSGSGDFAEGISGDDRPDSVVP
jgi:hypothetical protein